MISQISSGHARMLPLRGLSTLQHLCDFPKEPILSVLPSPPINLLVLVLVLLFAFLVSGKLVSQFRNHIG